ncbi:non-homologous end-joining DNA ligase LigD [Nocardioides terrisoli]|uniref:non-homologous end-joining DNA ligase LigD n=1 Tax=Nocardioides terrisoli TaxID=3388267 RepID=UPI00287B71F2|nr:DNA polymerase ligase N-terminal domain-containing protein [Nocardioides marmorisolisilvae]
MSRKHADDRLAAYRGKRDFDTSAEPSGVRDDPGAVGQARPGARQFVVQRHRAQSRHYDLRLEIDGVLVSWAVPKGPTLDPSVRRLAMHVEDHPLEYADFEGVIPRGEYGGGDVIVWDRGTWEPHGTDDPARAVADGELHADVHGEKLRGRLVLVRRSAAEDGKEPWFLVHKHDEFAVEGWDPEDHPRSVTSGRTNEEVRVAPDSRWHGDRPAAQAEERVATQPRQEAESAAVPPTADDLAALDDLGDGGTWDVFGRRLEVTHLDKRLFPGRDGEPPVTKRDFLRYVAQVAPVSVPHLEGRALNLHRYPDGADPERVRGKGDSGGGFWHKELPDHAPDWIGRWDNPLADAGTTQTYLVVDEPAALLWAANFGALEWHPWTSRTDEPECPTFALFDIDPGESTSWEQILELARLHRTALEQLGLRSYPKVTGSRGIQVSVPIRANASFEETRGWVEQVSRTVGKIHPELVSWKWQRKDRGGRARLDHTQNAINKTLVAPYSTRPRARAPVSMPIGWHELDDPELRPDRWTIRTAPARLAEVGDLFRGALVHDQALPAFR